MRSPVFVNVTAVAKSPLVPLNYAQPTFNTGIAVVASEDNTATGAATVQVTYDDFSTDAYNRVSVSQTTTVITITDLLLPLKGGVIAGDVVVLRSTGNATLDGQFTVATTPTPTTYTLTSGVSQSATGGVNSQAAIFRLFNTGIVSATSLRAFGLLGSALTGGTNPTIQATGPVTGVLLNVTTLPAGSYTMLVVQGVGG